MLFRNVDQSLGLCNGIRLLITKMRKYVVEAKLISKRNIGQNVYNTRLSLTLSYERTPFKFQQRQFSLVVSFAVTTIIFKGNHSNISLQHFSYTRIQKNYCKI